MSEWWRYENLKSKAPYDWHPAGKGKHPDDNFDHHIDLGAGKLPKGRLTIDRHGNCNIKMDLNTLELIDSDGPLQQHGATLPFPDNSIESVITHHFLEHLSDGFLRLMDEVYRVLKPAGKFRIIVPLFPSLAAVSDPDHKRYFCETTFESFCGVPGTAFWSDSFAEPYTNCRFILKDKMITPPQKFKVGETIDIDKLFKEPREIRCTLQKPTK